MRAERATLLVTSSVSMKWKMMVGTTVNGIDLWFNP